MPQPLPAKTPFGIALPHRAVFSSAAAASIILGLLVASLALAPEPAGAQVPEDFGATEGQLKTGPPLSPSPVSFGGGFTGTIIRGFVRGFSVVLDTIADFIGTLFVGIAGWVFGQFVQFALTDMATTTFVQLGFSITLGVANMFFVLILLWIAIATIFDWSEFSARSLLPKLIIAALLINFSLAIGSAFIKLSNGIANIFYLRLVDGLPDEPQRIYYRIQRASRFAAVVDTNSKTVAGSPVAGKEGIGKFPKGRTADETVAMQFWASSYKLIVSPILIFVLLAGSVFLLIRQLALAFILVLGPMAFLFMILPATQSHYKKWWEALSRWAFFFPAFMFFLFLSLTTGEKLLGGAAINPSDTTSLLVQYSLVIGLLIGSLLVANQMGVYGAGAVNKLGKRMSKGVGRFARNKGIKTADWTMEKTRVKTGLMKVPVLRWLPTAVSKKADEVRKKEREYYTKLNDKDLASATSRMSRASREDILRLLPQKRVNESQGQLRQMLMQAGRIGTAPMGAPQIQALQNSTRQIVQGMHELQILPVNIQTAIVNGVQQAIQNLPPDADPATATRTITETAQRIATQQATGTSNEAGVQQFNAAIQVNPVQGQIQNAVSTVRVPAPPRPEAARGGAQHTQELEERVEALTERLEELEGRPASGT